MIRKRVKYIWSTSAVVVIATTLLLLYCYMESKADNLPKNAIVYVVPVYGQSLALGEETIPITDFDNYSVVTNGRVKSEFLNDNLGYYSGSLFTQWIKSIIHRQHRHFESSIFGLGECFVSWNHNPKAILCTFPAGQGETGIENLGKGSVPYNKFIDEIKYLAKESRKQGATVVMPAFCWMQGENDLVWNTGKDYARLLKQFREDVQVDVQAITYQEEPVECILYQTNCLSLSKEKYDPQNYTVPQMRVPMAQRQLIIEDPHFHASGPVYPYDVMREYVHIDAKGQKQMGWHEGHALQQILKHQKFYGLQYKDVKVKDDTLLLSFNIPCPPLKLDTINVTKAPFYGFSVINNENQNILRQVFLRSDTLHLVCSHLEKQEVSIRYGVNGDPMKSGRKSGPRGNLCDSQEIPNWCYMFVSGI